MMIRPADNPFASRRIDGLAYRFLDGDADALLRRLTAAGGRGAIVGRHGRGKTTLLEHLAPRLEGEIVWIRLDSTTADPLLSATAALPHGLVGPDHAVLVDGSEQLGPVAWWRLGRRIRRAGWLVITGHRSGRLPTIHECTTSPELLSDLMAELAPTLVDSVDLDDFFHRHDGNLRLCFRELYDLVK